MREKVSVIGIGRLGLSFALLLDSKGYDVMGCDVNETYIDSLKDKTFSSKEPEVNELLKRSEMQFTTDAVTAFNHSDLIFVFVPTPSKVGGNYDHNYIDQVVFKLLGNKITDKTLVIGCTVMPGFCRSLQERLSHPNISVVYSPEFIAQGSIIDGLRNADLVLVGGENIPVLIWEIYKDIMDKEPLFKNLSLTGAEIAKISINCFLTLKISFANLIGEIATNSKEEDSIAAILDTIGSDSRIGKKYLSYGFPAGGICLPRDQKALNHHAYSVGVNTKFTHAIDTENNRHSSYLFDYYQKRNPDKDIPFSFSYLSYKKGVDILTDSYQLKLCIDLLRAGYKVIVPASVTKMDTSEEFNRYVAYGVVSFEQKSNAIRIN